MNQIIGIIGGMGPLATCDLFHKAIEMTQAKTDQEHAHIIIDCNTNIPDRTQAILYGGPSPVPEIRKSAERLIAMGAKVLIMPCNTAHFYYDEICRDLTVPLLHMPKETAKALNAMGYHKVGLLATEGTLKAGIYQEPLLKAGITPIIPTEREQIHVTKLIYDGVKAGQFQLDLTGIHQVTERLFADGAETLLLACTELPIAFQNHLIHTNYVDPLEILAAAALTKIGKTPAPYPWKRSTHTYRI